MKIVVLAGGLSTERAVSLVTGNGICRALRERGHRAILVDLFLGLEEVPEDLEVLHASKVGRIHTLIMRMNAEEAKNRLAVYEPMLVDAVPLTLEEIFIYELGGADYAVKDIVL